MLRLLIVTALLGCMAWLTQWWQPLIDSVILKLTSRCSFGLEQHTERSRSLTCFVSSVRVMGLLAFHSGAPDTDSGSLWVASKGVWSTWCNTWRAIIAHSTLSDTSWRLALNNWWLFSPNRKYGFCNSSTCGGGGDNRWKVRIGKVSTRQGGENWKPILSKPLAGREVCLNIESQC